IRFFSCFFINKLHRGFSAGQGLISPAVLPGKQRTDRVSLLIHIQDPVHLPRKADPPDVLLFRKASLRLFHHLPPYHFCFLLSVSSSTLRRITSASCSRAHGSAVSIKLSLPTVTASICSPLSPSRTDRLTDVVPISIPSVFIIRSIPVLWFSRSFSALPEYFY